jgi:Flp pilus assembly protein TadB
MNYNWEKIFENKTDKELYEIYSGNSVLPNETAEYARQELEKRKFDFGEIEANKSAWQLSELFLEAESAQKLIKQNQARIIPYKSLYFLVPGIIVLYVIFFKFLNINLTIFFPTIMIGLTLWYVSFTNRVYAKQKEEQNKRLEKIIEIKERIKVNLPTDK